VKLTMRAGDPHPVSAGERAPTPHFDGHELVKRLVSKLTALERTAVLIPDELHELSSPETLAVQVAARAAAPFAARCAGRAACLPIGLHRRSVAESSPGSVPAT